MRGINREIRVTGGVQGKTVKQIQNKKEAQIQTQILFLRAFDK